MSVENLKSFYNKLLEDQDLQAQVKDKTKSLENQPKTEQEVVEMVLIPMAQEANLPFSLEEYETLKEEKEAALSDEKLESVAGGTDMVGTVWGICVVFGTGYDTDDDGDGFHNCLGLGISTCVVVGAGPF